MLKFEEFDEDERKIWPFRELVGSWYFRGPY